MHYLSFFLEHVAYYLVEVQTHCVKEEKLPQNSSLRDLDRFQFIMSRDTKAARPAAADLIYNPTEGNIFLKPTVLVRPFSSGGNHVGRPYRARKSLCTWFGESCSCCLPPLPQLACSILPTMYKDFFRALYRTPE